MENLSNQELIQISGGGIFGNGANTGGISISASTDSLLSITFFRTMGDKHSETTISIGNDIALQLGLGTHNQ